MTAVLLSILAAAAVAAVGLLAWHVLRREEPGHVLGARLEALERSQLRAEQALREELAKGREESAARARDLRDEVARSLKGFGDSADKRLSESFQRVSESLETVHKGLGEMQGLAAGVGDLKKILTNVKTRGTFGEVRLGELLDQMLTPDQFAKNVATRPESGERVEFAIKLPGDGEGPVWLPVDAKFPQEDYARLVDASERAATAEVEEAARQLELRVRAEAKKVREKYVQPPGTTDFAILFLPTEGLFSEVLRRPGLVESLQREHRVVVAGPTTFCAMLNSLQMGFRTLAIQKRTSEVWEILGAVKSEFGQFGVRLAKVQRKLSEATNAVEDASKKTRTIERKLRGVEELPAERAAALLEE